jgi:hypothetical protein
MLGVLALLAASQPAARAHRASRSARTVPPASLVASFHVTSGKSGNTSVWFVDSRGREFMLAPAPIDILGRNIRAGTLSAADVAHLITVARPLPKIVPPADVDHALALADAAARAANGPPGPVPRCHDGGAEQLYGYVPAPPGAPAQKAVLLRHTHCASTVDENPSLEARELIAWMELRRAEALRTAR